MSGTALRPEDPQRLGRYWLAARLGSGGQGVVYDAYDHDGVRVAIKVLHSGEPSRPEASARSTKEVTAARRVASFCTAKVLDAGEDGGKPYIVSEFIPGPSLRAAIRTSGPFRGDDLVRLATGMATALTAIHQAGVVHRDLKPDNVLLGPDGPRVIDFGIARTLDMTLTETGPVMGTLGYMAPEVLSGKRADAAADIFAWGVVVLFAATGQNAFAGENIGEVVVRAVEHEPDLDSLPERLRPLVRGALAKHPENRPSAAAVLLGLLGAEARDQQAALQAGAQTAARLHVPEDATVAVPGLGDQAEGAYNALPPAAQTAAREVFLRLVTPGEPSDGSQDTVRSAAEAELISERPSSDQTATLQAINAFTEARILIRENTTLRPAGAALLRAWQRLRHWVDEDRAGLRIHRRLGEAAEIWQQHGRGTEDLYHGTALRSALDWAATAPEHLRLNAVERQFLATSKTADTRRAGQRRRLLAGTALLLAVALVAGAIAWQQNRANEQQRTLAEARRLAAVANSLRFADPVTAMQLSVASWRIADVTETRSALLSAMTQKEVGNFDLPARGTPYISDDGRTVVTVKSNRIERWDVDTHRRTGSFKGPGTVDNDFGVTMSPDAQILALRVYRVTEPNAKESEGIRLWDIAGQRWLGKMIRTPEADRVRFSPSGRTLILVSTGGRISTVRLWDIKHQRFLLQRKVPTIWTEGNGSFGSFEGQGMGEATISAKDRYVALCPPDGRLELWDVKLHRRLPTSWAPTRREGNHNDYCEDHPFFYNGDERILGMLIDGKIRMWNIISGKELPRLQHPSLLMPVFSRNGEYIATASENEILLWRLTQPDWPVFRYPLVNESVDHLWLDERARKIRYVASGDFEVDSIRSLDLGQAIASNWRKEPMRAAEFSPDGRLLVTARKVQSAIRFELLDGYSGHVKLELPEPSDQTNMEWAMASFSSDGKTLAYGLGASEGPDAPDSVALWDLSGGGLISSLEFPDPRPHEESLISIALSQDGNRLMLSWMSPEDRERMEIWNPRTQKKIKTLASAGGFSVATRPDGKLLAIGHSNRGLGPGYAGEHKIVSLPAGKVDWKDLSDKQVSMMSFSADGKYLAVGDQSGRVTLWDRDGDRKLAMLAGTFTGTQQGEPEAVSALAFSRDGGTLAVGGTRGSLQLWDIDSSQILGSSLSTPGDGILSLSFGPNNDYLYVAGRHVTSRKYQLNPQILADAVCKRASDGLSRDEWKTYVREIPYRNIC